MRNVVAHVTPLLDFVLLPVSLCSRSHGTGPNFFIFKADRATSTLIEPTLLAHMRPSTPNVPPNPSSTPTKHLTYASKSFGSFSDSEVVVHDAPLINPHYAP